VDAMAAAATRLRLRVIVIRASLGFGRLLRRDGAQKPAMIRVVVMSIMLLARMPKRPTDWMLNAASLYKV
jgi:hypothetical protein